MKKNVYFYLNNKKINDIKYNISKKGKYKLKIIVSKSLINMSWIFFICSSLTSLNLSNYNTFKVIKMRRCSLIVLLYFIYIP